MSAIYQVNKGVSRPIVFKGLIAQYIAYLAIGLVAMLLLFVVLYVAGLPIIVLLPIILVLGLILFIAVYRLSATFGEHGLMKFFASANVPACLVFRSRRLFTGMKFTMESKFLREGRS
ncbi:DUF4133 domain-containing protein [Pedobacter sp. Leaf194]|uniref:DUF4133 domain-containing protein n=1 Tax=Pedobacter sp. Leaf194 TaxID=1736297 RepID=UPI0007030CA5|nr:DUF4133 domain-containing protein [Pedobacter sp. Leaf194]KQS36844.1 hypothetical protein ASG14_07345 [Pedobacter sp. Leaf194]